MSENPGPGAYNSIELGNANYYSVSKYRNHTNGKISPIGGMAPAGRISLGKTIDVGPGSYSINVEDINRDGRYKLSNHESSRSRVFDKEKRASLVNKHMLNTPAPGS